MKHSTDSNTIVTKMSVPADDYKYTKVGEYFTEVSVRWQNEPWIKYLYEHGCISHVDTYKDSVDYSTVYVVRWTIKPHMKTLLLLQWSEQLDKTYV